ncbi:hypothetical protein [Paenibacillus lupini]|uniref:hypothetical protein n=1 Tax=Paenibacillus lupini TaxID=1450204 RepID=UPI0014246271|nr:hypothetical protein [Paenibacillus lupini]NIK22193.1 hypothetical protein [Paenibacillus lupini]
MMQRSTAAAAYATSKIAAAGLVFLGFLVIVGGFDAYQMSQLTHELPVWQYIYGYAILFSVLVDIALYNCKPAPYKKIIMVLLYILGGYVPFLFWFPNQWMLSLIAGLCGVTCSLAFLVATYLFRRWRLYKAVAAILLLVVAVYVSVTDSTEVKLWSETRTIDGYHAEFAFFNGQKKIPITLEKGQTLSYHINWKVTNGGGYGTYLDAKGGNYTSNTTDSGDWITYQVEMPSTVSIVVSGDQAQGELTIKWKITN